MDNKSQQSTQQVEPEQNLIQESQQQKKEERVNELDIIGGMLIKFVQKIFSSIKRRVSSS